MAQIIQSHVAAPIPQAPIESSPTVQVPYSHQWVLRIPKDSKGKDISKTLRNILDGKLQHMGHVTLYEMQMRVMFTQADQVVTAVFANETSTASIDQLSGIPGSFMRVATSYNIGAPIDETLVVPGLFSRQIQPVSSTHPTPKIMIKIRGEPSVWLTIRVIVDGPIIEYSDLN